MVQVGINARPGLAGSGEKEHDSTIERLRLQKCPDRVLYSRVGTVHRPEPMFLTIS